MKDFKDWGIRVRKGPGYFAIWYNLKTIRLDMGPEQPLPPERSEFYDIGITSRCNASCNFCYVSAGANGKDAPNPDETWRNWMATFPEDKDASNDPTILELCKKPEPDEDFEMIKLRLLITLAKKSGIPIVETEKAFQGAAGSIGEITVHPKVYEFLQAIYETKVVPNYTTNGILLSDKDKASRLLEATRNFCGGVAVSFSNLTIRPLALKAIENLLAYGECKVVIHHIISDIHSVDEFISLQKSFGKDLHYHVLLPLMAHGRSNKSMEPGVYEYLAKRIQEENITNVAFGANFAPYMKANPGLINVWEYPQEIYSKNIILGEKKLTITPSSFNLTPIKEICGL